jgi:cyclohexanecarboxylate-CoA ligase
VGTLDELCLPSRAARGAPDGARAPGTPADGGARLVDGAQRWSSADLDAAVGSRAAELAAEGVGRGGVVSWPAANVAGSVVEYVACWALGAVAAPVHHLAGPAQAERIAASLARAGAGPDDRTPGDRGPGARTPDGSAPDDGRADDSAQVAVVLHTSGSGGSPKGVLHTHRSLAYKARSMVEVHGLTSQDVVLMPAPLAHVSGLLNGILVPAAAGMTTVLMSRWSPEDALALIEAEQVTFMVGPPTFFIGMEQAPGFDPSRVASLRLLSLGGAGVTPGLVRHLSAAFGAGAKRSYGSTEAPTVTTSTHTDDEHTRAETDGHPVGAVRLRTADPVTGVPVPAGGSGEVQVSGPELFAGYLDPARTAEATVSDEHGDWFRTGDLGRIDGAGRLTITGRLGDVIIRGGENIDAAEVEAHLVAHPAVAHAVVVGEPDERLGERVCAFVELGSTGPAGRGGPGQGPDGPFDLGECRAWFASRGVTRFMTPERVVVLDRLPLLPSGKADRSDLARRAADLAHPPN